VALSLVSFLGLWPEVEQTDAEIVRRLIVFGDGYPLGRERLDLAVRLIPDRCQHIGAMIAAGADREEPSALGLRDRGFVTYFSTVAQLAAERAVKWVAALRH
jgi:hypothetical protein